MRLGLISDTHNRLDPRVTGLLAGVDHILHAGDVCEPLLIAELEVIAPVTVVLGNNDDHLGWREAETVEFGGHRILVQHIVSPESPSPAFRNRLRKSGARIVVFGHSHRAYRRVIDDVLFLNPGSAGAPRFGLPCSIARMNLSPDGIHVEFLDLDGGPLPI